MQEEQDSVNKTKRKSSLKKDVLQMIIYLIGIVIVSSFLYHYVGQQVVVKGSSMEQNLYEGDRLILEKVTYRFENPKRYDIIVFHPEKEKKDVYFIKRIIGLPGETIFIKDGFIYVNDKKLEEDYGSDVILDSGLAKEKILLSEDEYFVLGDNRNNSRDSRSSDVGMVKKEFIVGRAFVRIWPISKIGILKHQ